MGVGAGLYMCDVVVKSSRSLSHLLMSSSLTGCCTDLDSGLPCFSFIVQSHLTPVFPSFFFFFFSYMLLLSQAHMRDELSLLVEHRT